MSEQTADRPKRQAEADAGPTQKALRTPRLAGCSSVRDAAEALLARDTLASFVKRPLSDRVAGAFARYVASRPRWPDTEDLHPLEATHDRIAIIDFLHGHTLCSAVGYGKGLPPRHSSDVASASAAIATVLSVLPEELAAAAALDAAELLQALRESSGGRQYILRLELVLGDTCQRWHRDLNICRSIVTYVGPGTQIAHEQGVTREADGSVAAVDAQRAMHAAAGDFLFMKGGLWPGAEGRGAAHRAPSIGPVPTCAANRLLLKVDCSEEF